MCTPLSRTLVALHDIAGVLQSLPVFSTSEHSVQVEAELQGRHPVGHVVQWSVSKKKESMHIVHPPVLHVRQLE